jgi:hypothetical protein
MTMSNKHMMFLVAATLLSPALVAPVHAADLAPADDGWHFAVAPYLWGAGMNGDVGLFGREPVDIDVPFRDVLSDLDIAAMGVFEAHNGQWGFFGDLMYVDTESKGSIEREVESVGSLAQLKVTVGTQSFVGTAMGEYRLFDGGQATFDIMAGGRVWDVNNDISARLSADGVKVAEFSGDDGATWIDPMVGVRTRIETGSPLYFTGWGMIGGFGVGSDLSWDVMGGAGYQWTESFATVLGYRALGVDYKDDGFVYDVTQHGVILGGVFNF